MKVTYQKPRQELEISEEGQLNTELETETIDLYTKFVEYLRALEAEDHRVKKIVMHPEMYQGLRMSDEYQQLQNYRSKGEFKEEFMGVEIRVENLGRYSIADFLIYTDKKVVHSDMIDKNFVEDLDVEQLLHKTNEKIDNRET